MNYQHHYNKLIEKAKNRILESYTETHHIIPKCLGGTDDKINLVKLTPEEHYVAHQLLVKIYPNNDKLIYSSILMTIHDSEERVNNKLYGWLKRMHSKIASKRFKKLWADEKYRNKIITSMIRERNTDEAKKRFKIAAIKNWNNSKDKNKRIEQIKKIQKENNKLLAERNKKLWETEEYRIKMKKARSGFIWWTDGVSEIKSKICPNGFKKGRKPYNGNKRGRKNNETK